MKYITTQDLQNMLGIIDKVTISGAEALTIVMLKENIIQELHELQKPKEQGELPKELPAEPKK